MHAQSGILERVPFPPTGDLSDPGIKPAALETPAVAGRFFTTGPPGKPDDVGFSSVTQSCPTL